MCAKRMQGSGIKGDVQVQEHPPFVRRANDEPGACFLRTESGETTSAMSDRNTLSSLFTPTYKFF